jgi:hypothetical protein
VAYDTPTIVVPSAARVANGNSGVINPAEAGESISLEVDVTTLSGTPNLAITVEWSDDGVNFAQGDIPDSFVAITTSPLSKVKQFERKGLFYRVVWVITGGTPSITFSVTEYVTA